MSQTTSPNAAYRSHTPVHDSRTLQMRAVRKELLLLRAEVERAEFVKARAELHRKFSNLSWLKLLVPGLGSKRSKGTSRSVNATISDWVLGHPLVSSLASIVLTKPLRAKLAAGAKPLLKWGMLGAAAWTGLRVWNQLSRKQPEHSEHAHTDTGDE
jgi:hypothetical protein